MDDVYDILTVLRCHSAFASEIIRSLDVDQAAWWLQTAVQGRWVNELSTGRPSAPASKRTAALPYIDFTLMARGSLPALVSAGDLPPALCSGCRHATEQSITTVTLFDGSTSLMLQVQVSPCLAPYLPCLSC